MGLREAALHVEEVGMGTPLTERALTAEGRAPENQPEKTVFM